MRDRYTLTERIDQGGMAEVFRGVAESLQGFKKNVAIKRILPNLTKNQKFVKMFLDEARLSLYLQHANIVQVFDIGQSESTYFLVMEYINGCNLKSLIERLKQRGRRMEVPHAVYLMLEACKALNYAHHLENPETGEPLNLVHRDISPPNILLSRQGEIKVVDFGLAKATSQVEITDPGVVKGKFSYLSPESASGGEVDRRADIFAVGIILWEMLTGRRLFYGDTDYQTVELVRQARVPSIAALNPEIEPELEAIVRKALERNPAQRYSDAADLGDALAQYLFSRRMKVTSRDIAELVCDTQDENERKRASKPQSGSIIDALIQEEMRKLTSLLGQDAPATPQDDAGGSKSLNPNEFVDTSSWAADFGFHPPTQAPAAAAAPPPQQSVAQPARTSAQQRSVAAPAPTPARATPRHASGGEVESLQQMLEPDRTGVHKQPEKKSSATTIVLVVAILLAAGLGVGVFLFKDKLFG